MSTSMFDIATPVRVAVARANIRPTELAREIGMTRQALTRKLYGEKDFSFLELFEIARVLGVSLPSLLPQGMLEEGQKS